MDINTLELTEIKRHVDACKMNVEELMAGYNSADKTNRMLNQVMQQMEIACLDMRRLCEKLRPRKRKIMINEPNYHSKSIYGEVTLTAEGWVHIKLNTLLPHYKILGGSGYISDCIVRLLNKFESEGGKLPMFEKAFLAIIEHCDFKSCEAFDDDNKGFKAVQNALKGRLFRDDDQFELSLGLFTIQDKEMACHIFVLPTTDTADFFENRWD